MPYLMGNWGGQDDTGGGSYKIKGKKKKKGSKKTPSKKKDVLAGQRPPRHRKDDPGKNLEDPGKKGK